MGPCFEGVPSGGHPHLCREGLPVNQLVLWLHYQPEVLHRQQGLPPVRVPPRANPAPGDPFHRPANPPGGGRDPQAQRPEEGITAPGNFLNKLKAAFPAVPATRERLDATTGPTNPRI